MPPPPDLIYSCDNMTSVRFDFASEVDHEIDDTLNLYLRAFGN